MSAKVSCLWRHLSLACKYLLPLVSLKWSCLFVCVFPNLFFLQGLKSYWIRVNLNPKILDIDSHKEGEHVKDTAFGVMLS